jgi:5-(carboxyamino)imidazole ribonucleotide synthase
MNHRIDRMLKPGSRIGILGGGQLGRMLAVAASRLGFTSHIFDPNVNSPASQVTCKTLTASYEDKSALIKFANSVDIITYEFENIPTSALDILEKIVPIRPGREALRVSQDRIIEKDFLSGIGLKTTPYQIVDSLNSLYSASDTIGFPAILKTTRLGYDGKGQVRLSENSDIEKEYKKLGDNVLVYEGFVDFEFEVSVIAARNLSGEVACYDPGQNVHINGILHSTTVPSQLTSRQTVDAVLIASKILESLNYVGVLGIEFFCTKVGLVVNEIAPRVHNSGHWTQNGCSIDQFEQHIRAITGWRLGDGTRHTNVVMQNLIGDEVKHVADLAKDKNISLHLYGKNEIKPGRKMGHFNLVKEK